MNLTSSQKKLIRTWVNTTKFGRDVLTDKQKELVIELRKGDSYNPHQKIELMKIREQWIKYLEKEQKWINLTRKEKDTITNEILDSTKPFRKTLSKSDLMFMVDCINKRKYKRTDSDKFERIMQTYSVYEDLPF